MKELSIHAVVNDMRTIRISAEFDDTVCQMLAHRDHAIRSRKRFERSALATWMRIKFVNIRAVNFHDCRQTRFMREIDRCPTIRIRPRTKHDIWMKLAQCAGKCALNAA